MAVDEWPDAQSFQTFFEEAQPDIGPVMKEAGVSSQPGPGGGPVADAVAPYLGDPRVRYSSTGTPVGAAGNMTALINSETAPYVALLHDDDRWEPDFLARRVAFL